jgi:hypothetical protein
MQYYQLDESCLELFLTELKTRRRIVYRFNQPIAYTSLPIGSSSGVDKFIALKVAVQPILTGISVSLPPRSR